VAGWSEARSSRDAAGMCVRTVTKDQPTSRRPRTIFACRKGLDMSPEIASRRLGRQHGQAMVEFAIMLPILLLLLLGGADLLMAIAAHQQVSYVAQETAQWCLANVPIGTPCGAAAGQAQTFASQLGLMNSGKVAAASNGCTITPACVSITATYSFVPVFPFFPSFTMTSTAQAFMPTVPGT
jgi:Flp pilus assembly protein TadG